VYTVGLIKYAQSCSSASTHHLTLFRPKFEIYFNLFAFHLGVHNVVSHLAAIQQRELGMVPRQLLYTLQVTV